MSEQLGFYFQQDRCIGCFTCQVACKDKNDLAVGQNFRRVHEFEGGGYKRKGEGLVNDVYAYWLSMSCNHCADPVCIKGCPTGAMQKQSDNGIVFIEQARCIGCRHCVITCPYGAPQFNPKTGKTSKCDMCKDLLAKGEKPVCVTGCPMRVLDLDDLDELRKKYQGVDQIKGMPEPKTKPSVVIKPHRSAVIKNTITKVTNDLK